MKIPLSDLAYCINPTMNAKIMWDLFKALKKDKFDDELVEVSDVVDCIGELLFVTALYWSGNYKDSVDVVIAAHRHDHTEDFHKVYLDVMDALENKSKIS